MFHFVSVKQIETKNKRVRQPHPPCVTTKNGTNISTDSTPFQHTLSTEYQTRTRSMLKNNLRIASILQVELFFTCTLPLM